MDTYKGDMSMMNKTENMSGRINISLRVKIALSAVFVVMILLIGEVKAQAAQSLSVKCIDYGKSTITVQMSSEDNVLLISDSRRRKWEAIPADKAYDNTVEMDISWIGMTKDYTLSLKGDISSEPISVIIPKQSAGLRASYNTSTGRVVFTGETGSVEWRKKESIEWNDVPSDEVFKQQLDSMCAYGAIIAFRTKGINGTGSAYPGKRPGKEIYVSVPKKIAAPNIKIDDSTLTVSVNNDMQYRMADEKGNPISSEWNDISKSDNMPLSQLASLSMVNAEGTNETEVTYIQFRTKATASKQVSNVTTVEIPAQTDLTNTQKENITIAYTSSTTFEIRVPFAGTQTPYEYCIINSSDLEDGITIDSVEDIKWTTINSTTPVPISRDNNKVDDGSKVYVRRKAVLSLGESGYSLASPAYFVGTVRYPGEVSTANGELTWLTTVAGRCNGNNPEGYLSFELLSPTESVVSEIKFVDYISIGTTRDTLTRSADEIRSSVRVNTDPLATEDEKYIITTTITSTAKLDRFASDTKTRKMLAYITLQDSTKAFESSSEKGVGINILPATKVNNPSGSTKRGDMIEIAQKLGWQDYNPDTDPIEYTGSFERIAGSTRDISEFRIRLDLGTRYIPSNVSGEFTDERVAITSICADNVNFSCDNGFTVEYADTVNDYNEQNAMAVITVNTATMENLIDDRNTPVELSIRLNNGEILKNVASITFKETATIVGGPYSWTITEGSLTLTDEVTTSSDGGNTTTTTTVTHVDKTITLKIFKSDYDVSLISVKWGDTDICTNISKVGADVTLDLSNKLINGIDVNQTTTKSLRFIFDNGFVLSTGYSLTINPAA
ncbi:MAG: hypothetical protein K6F93_07235 [Lachnospiraceae bacterium]|nr:hypothetical protein [Lachnospiraceae bacterium]